MKKFILKGEKDEIYVECVFIGTDEGRMKITPTITFERPKAAIYEEDKANVYLKELNKNGSIKFVLEEINDNNRK